MQSGASGKAGRLRAAWSEPEGGVAIRLGIGSGAERIAAAELYWLAFAPKLGRLLGPAPRALALIAEAIRADHAMVATDTSGALVAIGGFRSDEGSFVTLRPAALRRAHGLFGGLWRGAVLRALGRDRDTGHFLIDGLAVAPTWRGRGIGTALIAALAGEARRRGYPTLRLDVADTNPRARALYERLGFVAQRDEPAGLVAPLFGYRAATVMVRPL